MNVGILYGFTMVENARLWSIYDVYDEIVLYPRP